MKHTLTAIAGVALIALTACGANVEKDATYSSGTDLAKALNTVDGISCDENPHEESLEKYNWVGIPCDNSHAAIFATSLQRSIVNKKNPLEEGEERLDGPNWNFVGQRDDVEAVQAVLGGEIYEPPTATAPPEPEPVQSPTGEATEYEYKMYWIPDDGENTAPIIGNYYIMGVTPGQQKTDVTIPSSVDDDSRAVTFDVETSRETGVDLWTFHDMDGVIECEITNLDTGEVVDVQTADPGTEQMVSCRA